jgi:hypothetical protein
MNLVMQFRKVCNHPDLFERQEPKTPLLFESPVCQAPRLIYDMESFQRLNCGAPNEVRKMFSIFSAANVHRSSLGMELHNINVCWYHNPVFLGESSPSTFSITRLLGLTPQDVAEVHDVGPTKM